MFLDRCAVADAIAAARSLTQITVASTSTNVTPHRRHDFSNGGSVAESVLGLPLGKKAFTSIVANKNVLCVCLVLLSGLQVGLTNFSIGSIIAYRPPRRTL